jgi:transposase
MGPGASKGTRLNPEGCHHPPSVRYRERNSVARAKSDRMDAELLANILRNDRNAHRPLPADSELVQAIGVVGRNRTLS